MLAAQSLAPHDRRRARDRRDRAEVVHVELPLQVVALELGERREARRQPRGVEQAVEPAELAHRSREEQVEARIVAHVHRDPDRAARELRHHRRRDPLRRWSVQVGHDHVRALLDVRMRRRLADPASAAHHDHHVPRQQQ